MNENGKENKNDRSKKPNGTRKPHREKSGESSPEYYTFEDIDESPDRKARNISRSIKCGQEGGRSKEYDMQAGCLHHRDGTERKNGSGITGEPNGSRDCRDNRILLHRINGKEDRRASRESKSFGDDSFTKLRRQLDSLVEKLKYIKTRQADYFPCLIYLPMNIGDAQNSNRKKRK